MTTRITPGVGANLLGQHAAERNQDATAYVGNLDAQVLVVSSFGLIREHHSCSGYRVFLLPFTNSDSATSRYDPDNPGVV